MQTSWHFRAAGPGPPTGASRLPEAADGGATRGRLATPNTAALVSTSGAGRIRLQVATAPGSLELVGFSASVVAPGSTIRTDGARMLRRKADMGYTHEYDTGYNAADKTSVPPGVHLVASLLKRWLISTLHDGIADTHVPHYLDEHTFRLNRRTSRSRGLLFYRLLQQAVNTDPHPLATLIRPGEQ